jgi:hypothetical protein
MELTPILSLDDRMSTGMTLFPVPLPVPAERPNLLSSVSHRSSAFYSAFYNAILHSVTKTTFAQIRRLTGERNPYLMHCVMSLYIALYIVLHCTSRRIIHRVVQRVYRISRCPSHRWGAGVRAAARAAGAQEGSGRDSSG